MSTHSNTLKLPSKFCRHLRALNLTKENKQDKYSFCKSCGSVFLIRNNTVSYTIKPSKMQKPTEIDPVEIVKIMRLKQEYQYPNKSADVIIHEEAMFNSSSSSSEDEMRIITISKSNQKRVSLLNSNNKAKCHLLKKTKPSEFEEETLRLYLKYRKNLLCFMQKICLNNNYSDSSFYRALYFLDNYLGRNMNASFLINNTMFYITLGFLIISAKFGELDIFEPDFKELIEGFEDKGLKVSKIAEYEQKCLGYINFDLSVYSVSDWLMTYLYNGFIFEEEISDTEENPSNFIKKIYYYCTNILALITAKKLFLKFSPEQLALSILKIARRKLLSKKHREKNDKNFEDLLAVYYYKAADFEKCYKTIRKSLEEKIGKIKEEGENDEGKKRLVMKSHKSDSKIKGKIERKSAVNEQELNVKEKLLGLTSQEEESTVSQSIDNNISNTSHKHQTSSSLPRYYFYNEKEDVKSIKNTKNKMGDIDGKIEKRSSIKSSDMLSFNKKNHIKVSRFNSTNKVIGLSSNDKQIKINYNNDIFANCKSSNIIPEADSVDEIEDSDKFTYKFKENIFTSTQNLTNYSYLRSDLNKEQRLSKENEEEHRKIIKKKKSIVDNIGDVDKHTFFCDVKKPRRGKKHNLGSRIEDKTIVDSLSLSE